MRYASVWQDTRTFFPLFLEQLRHDHAEHVHVVGASDGKFVVPLARHGIHITAIEHDPLALDGGQAVLPGPVTTTIAGLRARLAVEGLSDWVTVLQQDLLEIDDVKPGDGVWTSCSWHYSINHSRPLAEFIERMKSLCRAPGSVFGAEYMMPVEPRHFDHEHYLEAGEIRRYLRGWEILFEAYTPPFVEAPHIEQLRDHVHRMGVIIARKPETETTAD